MIETPSETPRPARAILVKARALLADRGWCRESYAVDAAGCACEPTDRKANSFCALGALLRAARDLRLPDEARTDAEGWLRGLPEVHLAQGLAAYNDRCGESRAILRLFDRAIAAYDKAIGDA